MKLSTYVAVLLAGLVAGGAGVARGDLIVNGDFEATGGFHSDYALVDQNTSSTPEGKYALGLKPTSWNVRFASFGDHTTPDNVHSGQMLLANGSPNSDDRVWAQSVSVQAAWVYDVSFWAASAFADTAPGVEGLVTAPAHLVFEVDGTELFSINLTGQAAGQWNRGSSQFTAASTGTVELQIRDLTTAAHGNDFAIDDVRIAFSAVPEPSSLALLGIGSVVTLGIYSLRRRRATAA